jgi:hypothetical protein
MGTINPTRKMAGVTDAQAWPPKNVMLESFYLLTLGEKPVGKSFWSASIPVLTHSVQWTWIVVGTDLTVGKVGRNRGDRYRISMKMKEELLQATFPWFAQKGDWSVLGSTPSGLVLQETPITPLENMWWSPPVFLNKVDKDSGVIYGAASVQITAMEQTILS